MRKLIFVVLLIGFAGVALAQKKKVKVKDKQAVVYHYVCFPQLSDEYHNNQHCSRLNLCSGGRTRKIENVESLKPCKKCVKPVSATPVIAPAYKASGFADIKNVLGVKDKKQIADSLGTKEATIHRPEGFTLRISGLPQSMQVNTLEFYFDKPLTFNQDSLTSAKFYQQLGLQFGKCKADTVQNKTPHPVTGKTKNDFSIEFRGCAVVEPRDQYEDVSKYYYELVFVSKEGANSTEVEKIVLMLKIDR